MEEVKHGLLTMAISFLMVMTIALLTQIAYKESIYSILWIGLFYNVVAYFVSYYIAKKLLKSDK